MYVVGWIPFVSSDVAFSSYPLPFSNECLRFVGELCLGTRGYKEVDTLLELRCYIQSASLYEYSSLVENELHRIELLIA